MQGLKLILYLILLLGSINVPAEEVSLVNEDPSQAILIQDGNLSISIENFHLGELIDEIGYQAGFTIISYVELNQLVSYKFNNVPLGIALKKLLRNRSHMIHFDSTVNSGTDSTGTVKTLWLLPQQGDAQSFSRKRMISGYNTTDANRKNQLVTTTGSDDSVREDHIADLGRFNDSYALGEMSLALTDADSGIRVAAIESLAERGDVLAAKALAVALADVDPEVREEAVYALGDIGGETAIALLQQALGDSIDFVRVAAMDTLEVIQSDQ
jgi:hypothetical protein